MVTDLGAVGRRGAERRQRHDAGPVGGEAAGEPEERRGAEHQLQREAEEHHQEQRQPGQQVPGQRRHDRGPPPAAVAEPGEEQRGHDRGQLDDEVVGHVEVRHGLLRGRVGGVGAPVPDHHLQRGVEQGAAQLLQHQDRLDAPEQRGG